jgi:hypothetical protein
VQRKKLKRALLHEGKFLELFPSSASSSLGRDAELAGGAEAMGKPGRKRFEQVAVAGTPPGSIFCPETFITVNR